jgi:very-short-patch-repair endonuclease
MNAQLFARYLRKNMTMAERRLWHAIRRKSINGKRFLRQHYIQHFKSRNTEQFYIADFYCHELKLIVEVDGKVHEEQIEYDKIKDDTLKELGYNVVRFTNDQVINNLEDVVSRLKAITSDP